MPVVGIDLGTTYSAVAVLDDMKKPRVLPNAESSNVTPSVVHFESKDNIVVGEIAKNVSEADPDRIIEFVKNHMGKAQEWERNGEIYRPETVSAIILKKLKTDAEAKLGKPITGAVITVPAIFGDAERNATREAAAIAQIDVIDILDEPVAAALSYGLARGSGQRSQNVLVYDLGGGTFDITIMRISEREITMLHTDGNRQLGGKLWDDQIMQHVGAAFEKQHGSDPHDSRESAQTLRLAAEHAKRALTGKEKAVIKCDHDGKSLRVEITRDEFEKLTAHLLEQTETICKQVIDRLVEKGKLRGWSDIDEVLLVGGSSRMPQVPAMIRRLTGKEPKLFEPDLAVAYGAALYSEMKLRLAKDSGDVSALDRHGVSAEGLPLLPKAKVTRVSPFGLGTKVLNGDAPAEKEQYLNAVLIERNTPLPFRNKGTFYTVHDDQRSIKITMLEGDNTDPECCIELGQGFIRAIPTGLRKNSPVEIAVEMTDESLIRVDAVETTHGTSCTFELRRRVGQNAEAIRSAAQKLALKTVA